MLSLPLGVPCSPQEWVWHLVIENAQSPLVLVMEGVQLVFSPGVVGSPGAAEGVWSPGPEEWVWLAGVWPVEAEERWAVHLTHHLQPSPSPSASSPSLSAASSSPASAGSASSFSSPLPSLPASPSLSPPSPSLRLLQSLAPSWGAL